MDRKVTLIYCPYGRENPIWAETGYIKFGQKYIYFKPKDRDSYDKFKREEVIIIDGWREDIETQVEQFKQKQREYYKKKEQYKRELEIELNRTFNHIIEQKLNEWEKQNPCPKFQLNTPTFPF